MKKIAYFALLFLPLLFTDCKPDVYSIKGAIQNSANLQVILEQVFFQGQPVAISRATCDGSGNFTIEPKEPLPAGVYRLSIGAKRLFLILDGKEAGLNIEANLNTMDKMENVVIKGSETANCYADRIKEMFAASAGGAMTPQKMQEIINKGCNPLMKAAFSMQLLNAATPEILTAIKKTSEELNQSMNGSKYATDFAAMIGQVEKFQAQQTASETIKVGQPAPEITLPDPTGKMRNLSDLKGKVVLLDFWASWCGPCRRENPHVLEIYKKYKAKGFEVFSVSLDGEEPRMAAQMTAEQLKASETKGKTAWKAAIEQDGLIWENHVSDLKKWGSAPAAAYGVQAIPKTFLIDKNGNIAAINARQNLEAELLKVL